MFWKLILWHYSRLEVVEDEQDINTTDNINYIDIIPLPVPNQEDMDEDEAEEVSTNDMQGSSILSMENIKPWKLFVN